MAISIPINEDGTINRINVDGDEYYFGLEVNPESLAKVAAATDAATKAAEKANLGESSRVDAETKRVSAESTRANAETARDQAEQARAADQLKNNTDQEQNNAAARGLTYHVCGLGEYQLDTVDKAHNVPTVDGKTGVMYLTPKVNGETTEDRYDQWMYIEYKWELMGESGVHIDPTTTDDIDNIAAGTSVASDRVLNTTGLSYLWSKLKAAFAPKSHSHDATSITGSLEVSHGGTGATTAADALTNLGAASQTDVDALRDSVSRETDFQFIYGKDFVGDFVAYRKKGFSVEMIWNFNQDSTNVWVAGTLPAGFRPARSFLEPSVLANANGIVSNNTAEVEVRDSGQVVFISAAAIGGGRSIGHSVWIAA